MGGVYRDQGPEVLSNWLTPLFQSRVDAAYQNLRQLYLLLPETSAPPQPVAPTARYPLPDAGPALPSRLAQHVVAARRKRQRSFNSRESGSARAGEQGGVRVYRGYHIEMIANVPQMEVRHQFRTGPKT